MNKWHRLSYKINPYYPHLFYYRKKYLDGMINIYPSHDDVWFWQVEFDYNLKYIEKCYDFNKNHQKDLIEIQNYIDNLLFKFDKLKVFI